MSSRKIDTNKQIFSYREFFEEPKILMNECQAAFLSPFWRGPVIFGYGLIDSYSPASVARRYPR